MRKLILLVLLATLAGNIRAQYVFNKLSSISTPSGNAVYVEGSKAYVAAGTNGVFVYNISNPASPALLGSFNTAGEAKEIVASGNYIYVADGTGGFVMLDAGNLSNITMTDSVKFGSPAKLLALNGNFALVVTNDNNVYRVTLGNPSNLQVNGTYYTGSSLSIPEGIFAKNNYLYMAENGANGGFEILDIGSGSITQKSKTSTPGFQYDVYVEDTVAFLFEGNRLRRYGITNAMSPVLLSTYNIGDKKYEIAPSNNLVVQMGNDLAAYKQDTLVASYVPGFSRYEGIFTKGDTVFAVGDSLHIFILKKQTAGSIGSFNLLLPISNTRVLTNATNNNALYFYWRKATGASAYRHFVTTSTGSFAFPWINMQSSFSGSDTSIRHLIKALDTLAAQKGVMRGDSILLKWTVYAYSATDSLMAIQQFNLWLVREGTPTPPSALGAFHLLLPPDNFRIVTSASFSSVLTATWAKSSNATKYKWFITTSTGTFTMPLFSILSGNGGSDTMIMYPNPLLDTLAALIGVVRGDSVNLKWTVYAYLGSDSLKAVESNTLKVVRQGSGNPPPSLNPFNLINPVNNARIEVSPIFSHTINFNWTSAGAGAMYMLKFDTLGGNFSSPWASIPSNNSGLDTFLTVPPFVIDTALAARLVAVGDSVVLKWTVQASGATGSVFANTSFSVKIVRRASVGIEDLQSRMAPKVYPNPMNNLLNIDYRSRAITEITFYDHSGRERLIKTHTDNKLDVSQLENGLYYYKIIFDDGLVATGRICKE